MRPNRVFFPQPLLDAWIAEEKLEIAVPHLVMRDDRRRYRIVEAVHVISDAAGAGDLAKLVGKVKTKEELAEMSAEIFETSMVIGDAAYDVMPGFVGEPVLQVERSPAAAPVEGGAAKDEDLLAQFLLKSL